MLSADAIGAYLKEIRISRNIALEEVAEATGISPDILNALENDDKDRLPADIYIKAFYKKYAEHLGIDADGILALYQRQSPGKGRAANRYHFGTVVTLRDKEANRLSGIANSMFLAVIFALGGFLLYWIYKQYLASFNPFAFF